MMRKLVPAILAAGMAGLAVVGCQPTGGGNAAGGTSAPGSLTRGDQIGMVTDVGGTGDLSFNWMAWNGLQKAEKELGVQIKKIESSQVSDYAPNLQRLAEGGCKLIFAIGFALEPAVKEVAPKYPDVKFALIDAVGPDNPNVTGLTFREEEGCFLVGALAGGMTKKDAIGFVGGMEIELIKKFEAGFRAGIKTTNPRATVTAKFTGNWDQVDKGLELATSLFDQGADIVMHAAGKCGLGVIRAAKEKGAGYYAIGVDADQDYLGTATEKPETAEPPSRVLTSMMKRVDTAVFTVAREFTEGKFLAGKREFGVKDEAVGPTELKYTRTEIPEKLLAAVESLKRQISEGKLKIPTKPDDVDAFSPPKVDWR